MTRLLNLSILFFISITLLSQKENNDDIKASISNKEIARELGLTEGTVKGYVSQILEKLGISDRTEAALIAMRAGLLEG